ncbi:MAG: NADPH-dependent reductase [Clostridia bacterium]|jgi:multimeric flavodoxin WrbA|nr:NADPH-dependent reductase [Clostridia bacterium]
MKITVIYGTQRKSCTYNIAKQFIEELLEEDELSEFFLPKDASNYCRGCFKCFEDYASCPDYGDLKPILEAMLRSDLILFTSPVYVYHTTGQMKAFLDHFGYQWMAHQPRAEMFHKQALIISTAAGAGTKSAIKDIKDSTDFWGIAETYSYGKNVAAIHWEDVSHKKKLEIQNQVQGLALKIKKKSSHVRPSLKVKALFYMMRFVHKKYGFNPVDVAHWEKHGWLKNKRPW